MSSQVGSGHIAIFPTMRGFKGRVTREVKSAGKASASDFASSMKGAGRTAGTRLGRDMKSALGSSAKDLGDAALKNLTRDVAKASDGLSKARLQQQDAAGRVRVAETRLQEAVSKSGAESARAVAAEERLASARRAHEAATDRVTAASTRLRDAQGALASATQEVSGAAFRGGRSMGGFLSNLRAGYGDARAATSAFTGIAGSLGGIAKEIVILGRNTALGRWASTAAQQTSRAFGSLASMVGGGLARSWQASTRWMSSVGSYVGSAFAPMAQYAQAAAVKMSTPFVRLGSRVSSWLSPVTTQVSGLFSKIGAAAGPAVANLSSSFKSGLAGLGGSAVSALGSVVQSAASVGARAGQALASGLKNAATAGVAVVGTALGVALGSGIGRLTSLDSARAKLTGLGHDGKAVGSIMQDATASVKGTAFGLGEAANVAASAVAAQIKPGKALEGHLKNIANNASAAGISMEEMGGIFNKAATQANGVQNDVIGQLADKGIPIYQELADQLGVTAGEVFKMASEGKVDFETFSKAAEAAAGTVADEMGKTVPGALKNMLASLGRIGANIFGGIDNETGEMFGLYAKIGPLIASLTSALGPVEDMAKGFGATLDKTVGPALEWLTGLFEKIGSGSEDLKSKFSGLAPILAPLGAAFVALGSGGLGAAIAGSRILGPLLGGLAGPLAALGGPLGIAAAAFAGFALSGGDAEGLVSGLTGILDQVVSALPGIIDQVVQVVPQLVSGILSQVPALLTAAAGIVTALIDGLVQALPLLIEGGVQLLTGLVDAIVTNLPMIIDGAIQLVTALIEGIVQAIPLLIDGAIQLLSGLLTAIVDNLPMIIEGGIQLLMALVEGLIESLPMLLQAALDLVTGLLGAIIENLPMIIQAGIDLLIALVTGLIDALPQLITAAIELVLQLITGLLTMLPELIVAGIELVVALIEGLVQAIPQIIEMLPQIISAIWDGLMGVDWAGLGMDIVNGIIGGLASMGGALVDAVVDLAGSAFDGFKDFFGIASPAKRMIQPGRDVVRGAVAGVDDESGALGDSLVGMAEGAARRAQRAMTSASATVSASMSATAATASSGGGAQVSIRQENNFAGEDPEVGVELATQAMDRIVRNAL